MNEQLVAMATAAISGGNINKLTAIVDEMRVHQPFLYSLLNDTLQAAISQTQSDKATRQLSKVVNVRVKSLENWRQDDNETVAAIQSGKIDADAIKPHIRLEAAAYDQFYADQSKEIGRRLNRGPRAGAGEENEADYIEFGLGPNINHAFRHSHATSLVETILGIAGNFSDDPIIRWMDIGCGTGNFANGVNPRRYGVRAWDIVGCDLQEGKIALANRQRAKGRSFFSSDAFDMLEKYKTCGESFHLISMFEFLEHLSDPLRFVRQLDTFSPTFVLAASPLAQKMDRPLDVEPDRAHLWSFSRHGWEQMFELAGFSTVYSSEIRVGSYIGGLDWLSLVCGPRDKLRAQRTCLPRATRVGPVD